MGTVDERIDQLLQELLTIEKNYYGYQLIPEAMQARKEKQYDTVKKFMTDMGENIVRSQAVDEFVEYLKEYIDVGDGKMYVIVKQFKQEKGYE